MDVPSTLLVAWLASGAAATPPVAEPAADPHAVAVAAQKLNAGEVETRGGELRIRWNQVLLDNLGVRLLGEAKQLDADGVQHFRLDRRSSARWKATGPAVGGIVAGEWRVDGGPRLDLGRSTLSLRDAVITVRPAESLQLDVRSADGKAWLYVDQLMYQRSGEPDRIEVLTSDLRVGAALAKRLGNPSALGLPIGDVALIASIDRVAAPMQPKACGDPNWPGEPAPMGGTYQADVFMFSFVGDFMGCLGCDGPGGADGTPKFAPSSTLVNNRNHGAFEQTIVGDPLGTSPALWTADVSWNTKFSGPQPPYNNDQHPFLIWNLYRLEGDGGITQVGRSGVKHAFVSVNVSVFGDISCESCNGGHVLGIACGDTYGSGTNDSNSSQGPRREILPATGQWGRCGSIYDDVDNNPNDGLPGCDGQSDPSNNGAFDNRMVVRESDIDAAANPGDTWMFESWYIVREDVNPYNTMASRPVTFSWGGSNWALNEGNPSMLGPVIDRWVAPGQTPMTRNVELATGEGRTKVAVKVMDLGGGLYRYHYAVMNVDFARGITQNAEPNLRIVSNRGFDSVTIPVYAQSVSDLSFGDGDASAANDWTATQVNGSITWTAPAGNTLDWGTLFRFSFTADAAPSAAGDVALHIADAGAPSALSAAALVAGIPSFFLHGFEDP